VFFDLAGTLIHVRGALGHQYAAIAREFGVNPDPRTVDAVFAEAFQAAGPMLPPEMGSGTFSEKGSGTFPGRRGGGAGVLEGRGAGLYSRIGVEMAASAFDRYFGRLFDHFARAGAWDIYPDVEPTLERLQRSGLTLGLITNFDVRVARLLPALGLDRFFSTLAIPAHAGAAKPDGGILEYALAQHWLGAVEAVQVGDSLEDNVTGARAAGLDAVLLDRRGRHVGIVPPAIRSLEELPRRLGLER